MGRLYSSSRSTYNVIGTKWISYLFHWDQFHEELIYMIKGPTLNDISHVTRNINKKYKDFFKAKHFLYNCVRICWYWTQDLSFRTLLVMSIYYPFIYITQLVYCRIFLLCLPCSVLVLFSYLLSHWIILSCN